MTHSEESGQRVQVLNVLTCVRQLAPIASLCSALPSVFGGSLQLRKKEIIVLQKQKTPPFFRQSFFDFYSFVTVFPFFCFRYTMRTDMSAGDTPEIRDACPSDTGRILSNFCRASIEIPSRFK